MNRETLPLVVIGGFLGAGKTTMINNLLAAPEGRRLAVIVNDIGQLNIDDELITNARSDRIALSNGCICCSLQSDLFNAVTKIASNDEPIDAIVVEASGVSDPIALIRSIQLLESTRIVRADSVIYLIDGSSFDQLDYDEAERIIDHAALSDVIVVNKQDIATQARLDYIIAQLEISAPHGLIRLTSQAKIPTALLFAPNHSAWKTYPQMIASTVENSQNHDYIAFPVFSSEPVDKHRFEIFMRQISSISWRVKGFVRFTSNPDLLYLVNRVGTRASLELVEDPSKYDDRLTTRLVVVGRRQQLIEAILVEAFRRCLAE